LVWMICLASAVHAQDEEAKKGFDKSNLFFGGTFGLSFGSYTLVNVSPQVGYHFNRYFAAGTGVNFIYSQYKITDYNGYTISRQDQGYAGLNIFGRVYPIQHILLQVQPEINYSWGNLKTYSPDASYKLPGEFVPSVLVGIGGALPAGRSGAIILMIQYDLVQNVRSPYGNTIFYSFGYNVGF